MKHEERFSRSSSVEYYYAVGLEFYFIEFVDADQLDADDGGLSPDPGDPEFLDASAPV